MIGKEDRPNVSGIALGLFSFMSDSRSRTWTWIVYPESAPADWLDRLQEYHVPFAVSPLHQFDVNPDGEIKKAHWHVVFCFDGKKSYEQVYDLSCVTCGSVPQRCHDVKGLVRYFAHIDNPEKYQYNPLDIRGYCGFDVPQALQPSSSQRYAMISEMISYCKDAGIVEFQDLVDYAVVNHANDWFPLLCDNCTIIMQNYLHSARWRVK